MSDSYHMIDRYLRNTLDDTDYAEYSSADNQGYFIGSSQYDEVFEK